MLDEREMTAEEIEEICRMKERELAERLAPYIRAARLREESARIIAEHDDMLAEMLFEITMSSFGEEV